MYPVPSSLWHPPASFHAPSGTYVYLNSDNGDFIGQGASYTYTNADAILALTVAGRRLGVSVRGDQDWTGDFQGMNAADGLQVGYYPSLTDYPFNDFPQGGMDWNGEGRGCNQITGWFVIDRAAYTCGSLSELDMRFEQHCEGLAPALHGQIHYSAADAAKPRGPVFPIPSTLWSPTVGTTPSTGNFLFLASENGDYVGGGQTRAISLGPQSVTATGAHVSMSYSTSSDFWMADFQGMVGLTELGVGYYPNVMKYPVHNPARGGLDVSGDRGCNQLTGWFAVDSITYQGGALQAVDLRFEQRCDGVVPALHGRLHYAAP